MGIPVWTTQPGSLGTIQENKFYELLLEANDPDGGIITYSIIAGYLPAGLVLDQYGSIRGRPKELYYVRGVPTDVNQDITNVFVCRITSETGQVADCTFDITVTGQDAPELLTLSQDLGRFIDGTYVELYFDAMDLDNEPISWSIANGALPPGLSMNSTTGKISGYISPTINKAHSETVGWSADSGWNEYPWDHNESWINQGYSFTVEITDGKEYDRAKYTLNVIAKNLLTADLDFLTADESNNITADMNKKHNPVVLTEPTDLGMYAHDNYFAYQFQANDYDNDEIMFGLSSGSGNGFDSILDNGFDSELVDEGDLSLPPGLTLNGNTGWLYGYIGRQVPAQTEYSFAVYVYKADDSSVRSELVYFTITIIGDLNKALIWQTDNDLGMISTGSISELSVNAVGQFDLSLTYKILLGGRLPQGLKLLDNGLIVGQPTFEITQFDHDNTTFDNQARAYGVLNSSTTFNREFLFTVEASSLNRELIATRVFKITVKPSDFEPHENLYLRAQPGIDNKNMFKTLTHNTDLIPTKDVYRNGDPNFGRASDARMLLIGGLRASAATDYIQAMTKNHYRKTLQFGDIKVSKAYDSNRNILYEVLYYEIVDDQGNNNGSTALSKDLSNSIHRSIKISDTNFGIDNNIFDINGYGTNVIYPNSLANMRRQLQNEIGSDIREPLPAWMSNRQFSGETIGWKPVVVLAYLKPGSGDRILFNISRVKGYIDQKLISFEVDRYIWDNSLSINFDPVTGLYNPSTETTFDLEEQLMSNPVTVVDFAVEIPFNQIDGRTTEYIDDIGGLDGLVLPYNGLKIIFAKQESYTGYLGDHDGWIRSNTFWDDSSGWNNSNSIGWDDYEVIPGFDENLDDPTVVNERAGVWRLDKDTNEPTLWKLTFVDEISPGDTIKVKNGAKFGGHICKYGPLVRYELGNTVPNWTKSESIRFNDQTTFDHSKTRFIDNIGMYQLSDENDKYLIFPRVNIWS